MYPPVCRRRRLSNARFGIPICFCIPTKRDRVLLLRAFVNGGRRQKDNYRESGTAGRRKIESRNLDAKT